MINAVRFASAFFGKAQFIPARGEKQGNAYRLSQSLQAPYYQPLDPPRKVRAGEFEKVRAQRRQTEICRLEQSATVTETGRGLRVRMKAGGTNGVPVAVEINLREGGQLQGCDPAPKVDDAWILPAGYATYRLQGETIRFGPGLREHSLHAGARRPAEVTRPERVPVRLHALRPQLHAGIARRSQTPGVPPPVS